MELLHQSGEIIADKYRIIDILGQGSSGTTYQAENLQTGERVAIKALSLHEVTDWKMLELFEREVKILSQLNHPSIPRYLEYFQVDTAKDRNFYIVQQLAEGKSLAEWVESGWRTDEAGVRQIASQLLDILVYLHARKPPVIHRDIKPQNIIMRSPLAPLNKGGKENELAPLNKGGWGDLFLVDLGAVSNTYYNTLVRGSTVVGTFGYMAPEQFKGQAVPTTDLYGLGATLLFLLTHRSPAELPTDNLKIDFRRVQISETFADWLGKMLEPDVEDRFSSAKEALDVLSGKQVIYKNSDANFKSKGFNKFTRKASVIVGSILGSLYLISMLPLDSSPEAMCASIAKGKTLTVIIYLAWGGDPNISYGYERGSEPEIGNFIDCAAKYGKKDIAELLIAKGADVNAKNNNGDTPLHNTSSKEVAELLIAKGADVNAKNKDGDTPLHRTHSKEVAELLIAKGADVNAKNKDGDTPLHKTYSREVAELLRSHGAKE